MHYLNESVIDQLEELLGESEESLKPRIQEMLKICYLISTELITLSVSGPRANHLEIIQECLMLTAKLKSLIAHELSQGHIDSTKLLQNVNKFRDKLAEYYRFREINATLWRSRK